MTEGKLKNEAIDNYEYLLYKYSEIRVTSETLETEITITQNKQDRSYDCTNNVKINATVSLYDSVKSLAFEISFEWLPEPTLNV